MFNAHTLCFLFLNARLKNFRNIPFLVCYQRIEVELCFYLLGGTSSSDESLRSSSPSVQSMEDDIVATDPGPINEEMKKLLGDLVDSNAEGPEIHEELVSRWHHLIKSGLDKETVSDLIIKYAVPKNGAFLKAPILNGEVQSCIPSATGKQDNFLVKMQSLIACAISAVAVPFNKIIIEDDKDNPMLPLLVDLGKLLCNVQHAMSLHRKYLLSPHVSPSFKKLLDEVPSDLYLYGENLAERVKTNQAMKRTGSQLVQPPAKKTLTINPPASSHSLNYKRSGYKPRLKKRGETQHRDFRNNHDRQYRNNTRRTNRTTSHKH